MAINSFPTRADDSLGPVKSNAFDVSDQSRQADALQQNELIRRIIEEVYPALGLDSGSTPGSLRQGQLGGHVRSADLELAPGDAPATIDARTAVVSVYCDIGDEEDPPPSIVIGDPPRARWMFLKLENDGPGLNVVFTDASVEGEEGNSILLEETGKYLLVSVDREGGTLWTVTRLGAGGGGGVTVEPFRWTPTPVGERDYSDWPSLYNALLVAPVDQRRVIVSSIGESMVVTTGYWTIAGLQLFGALNVPYLKTPIEIASDATLNIEPLFGPFGYFSMEGINLIGASESGSYALTTSCEQLIVGMRNATIHGTGTEATFYLTGVAENVTFDMSGQSSFSMTPGSFAVDVENASVGLLLDGPVHISSESIKGTGGGGGEITIAILASSASVPSSMPPYGGSWEVQSSCMARNVTVSDTNFPFSASDVQESLERMNDRIQSIHPMAGKWSTYGRVTGLFEGPGCTDYLTANVRSEPPFHGITADGGQVGSDNGEAGRPGIGVLATGSSTNGFAAFVTNAAFVPGAGALQYRVDEDIPTASALGEDFRHYCGFFNDTVPPTQGAYFDANYANAGGNYRFITVNGGTPTITDTGVPAFGQGFQTLEILIAPDGSEVLATIDGDLVAYHTTEIPSSVMACGTTLLKLSGTGYRVIRVDLQGVLADQATPR